jgi:hypothetical protein
MSRQARRARHSRQVFGLAGTRRVVLLVAVASRSATSAFDGGRSCIPLRDSPGLSPGSLSRRIFNMPRSMPTPCGYGRPAAPSRYPAASASAIGRSPLLKSMVRRMVESSFSTAAATSTTSSRDTSPFPSGRFERESARPKHGPIEVAGAKAGIGGRFRLGVREKRIVLRYAVVRPGAEVRHHHEPSHARLLRGVNHPDRGVAVDGVGPRQVAAPGPGGEHDRIVPGEKIGQRVGAQCLDVGDDGTGARRGDVVGVVGVTEDRRHLVTALGQDAGQMQRDLPMAADDDNARHD